MAKTLVITESKIIVSANPYDKRGWIARHEFKGILPGCRKTVTLSDSTSYQRIIVRPLYGYNGTATIRPQTWRNLILASPIVSDRFSPIALTPELSKLAMLDALRGVDCASVTDSTDIHPSYLNVSYTDLEVA